MEQREILRAKLKSFNRVKMTGRPRSGHDEVRRTMEHLVRFLYHRMASENWGKIKVQGLIPNEDGHIFAIITDANMTANMTSKLYKMFSSCRKTSLQYETLQTSTQVMSILQDYQHAKHC